MKTKWKALVGCFVAVLAGVAVWVISVDRPPAMASQGPVGMGERPGVKPIEPSRAAPVGRAGLPDFSAVVEANKAAVVNITSTRNARRAAGSAAPELPEGLEDHPLFEFFRRFGVPMPDQEAPREGLGSGFIVQPDGIILTNAHVVQGADEVVVRLPDRREFKGTIVGVDTPTDIAVVRIDAKDLPTVRLGDPSKVKVGEWVLAIGSPFGFENTVTAGIVSGTSRSLPEGTYVPFIQTDAAVNPGNSGGPLFNLDGEVIGINSAIYSRTGGYQGIAFAIPIDVADSVKTQLVKNGKVERGRLGVNIQAVSQSLAKSFGLERPTGALVAGVEPGSPAAKAGLQSGDVLLSVNGHPIERSSELPPMIAAVKPGSQAQLEVWRAGRKQSVSVTVGELKPERTASAGAPRRDGGEAQPSGRLGLAVRPLTAEEKKQVNGQGVLVEDAGGPAARAGIQPGDVVMAVNNTPVASPEQLRSLVEKAKGTIALLVRRGDASLYVPIDLG
jgi:serine protease Do